MKDDDSATGVSATDDGKRKGHANVAKEAPAAYGLFRHAFSLIGTELRSNLSLEAVGGLGEVRFVVAAGEVDGAWAGNLPSKEKQEHFDSPIASVHEVSVEDERLSLPWRSVLLLLAQARQSEEVAQGKREDNSTLTREKGNGAHSKDCQNIMQLPMGIPNHNQLSFISRDVNNWRLVQDPKRLAEHPSHEAQRDERQKLFWRSPGGLLKHPRKFLRPFIT